MQLFQSIEEHTETVIQHEEVILLIDHVSIAKDGLFGLVILSESDMYVIVLGLRK
jgi:hypothetical protein